LIRIPYNQTKGFLWPERRGKFEASLTKGLETDLSARPNLVKEFRCCCPKIVETIFRWVAEKCVKPGDNKTSLLGQPAVGETGQMLRAAEKLRGLLSSLLDPFCDLNHGPQQ